MTENTTNEDKLDKIYNFVVRNTERIDNIIKDIERINKEGCVGNEEKIDALKKDINNNWKEHIFIKGLAYSMAILGFIVTLLAGIYYLKIIIH